MAGLSAESRDLAVVAAGFPRWWADAHPDDADVRISDFRTNPSSGYSSESLLFEVEATRRGRRVIDELVLRMPPAGGGLFPDYDMERQGLTQELLASEGVPAPAPATYELSDAWIGTSFMVMPRVSGRIPGDYTYPRRGWLFEATPELQRVHATAFIDALVNLASVDVRAQDWTFLHRQTGLGLVPEINWWHNYLVWACDGERHPVMGDAYDWAYDTAPSDVDPPSILWGDARFANTVFAESGGVVGMLDWEQAAIGPAELDLGFWLASRRQASEAVRVTTDPELPGFPTREEVVERYEKGVGRAIRDLGWHEAFAMIRMGTCIVSTQALLRRAGNLDHPFLLSPPLPAWTIDSITSGRVDEP